MESVDELVGKLLNEAKIILFIYLFLFVGEGVGFLKTSSLHNRKTAVSWRRESRADTSHRRDHPFSLNWRIMTMMAFWMFKSKGLFIPATSLVTIHQGGQISPVL